MQDLPFFGDPNSDILCSAGTTARARVERGTKYAGVEMGMTELVARYRLYAANCVEFAQRLPETESKLALLDMAQSWLVLAEQAAKNNKAVLVCETPIHTLGPFAVS